MTQLSKKLDQIIKNSSVILPVKTAGGILVGDVLIQSNGPIKNLLRGNDIIYKNIHLNAVAIKLANLLAKRYSTVTSDKIYAIDQEYGKWFVDSQMLRAQYQKSLNTGDFDRADMFWARYVESRDRAVMAKNKAQSLCII
jgi:hypothetical protein